MCCAPEGVKDGTVALLAEGVDRNMCCAPEGVKDGTVALLAEGVDRNQYEVGKEYEESGRPPRGGRG